MNIKSIVIVISLAASLKGLSQDNHQIRMYYGFVDSKLLPNQDLVGLGDTDNHHSYEFGVTYVRKLSQKLSLETGLLLLKARVTSTPPFMGVPVRTTAEKLSLLSIPMYVNYALGSHFYIKGGPLVDFQDGKRSFDTQSGIGYGLGIGGKYYLKDFLLFIAPHFKRHSTIPFKANHYQKLTQFGIEIGIGYTF